MEINREYTKKPYYNVSPNLKEQTLKGAERRKTNWLVFLLKKISNEILENLAYNCPVNSWRVKLHKLRGVNIGERVFIGRRVTLDHSYPDYIFIGDDVSLAGNNFVLTHSNPYPHFKNTFDSFVAPVIIGNGAWISIGATLLPGCSVGDFSVIAAGSVVSKPIPEKVIAGGIPAKVIKDVIL